MLPATADESSSRVRRPLVKCTAGIFVLSARAASATSDWRSRPSNLAVAGSLRRRAGVRRRRGGRAGIVALEHQPAPADQIAHGLVARQPLQFQDIMAMVWTTLAIRRRT